MNVLYFGESNRALLRIPRGVYHAIQNVGQTDVVFVNTPTRPYCFRTRTSIAYPLNTDLIPYRF